MHFQFGTFFIYTTELATLDVTAFAGTDFNKINQVVEFGIGENTANVTLSLVLETLVEKDERFEIRLLNPGVGGVLGTPSCATVFVESNDG